MGRRGWGIVFHNSFKKHPPPTVLALQILGCLPLSHPAIIIFLSGYCFFLFSFFCGSGCTFFSQSGVFHFLLCVADIFREMHLATVRMNFSKHEQIHTFSFPGHKRIKSGFFFQVKARGLLSRTPN